MANQQPEQFDAIVIGAGQAGPSIARHLVADGKRVAVVEQDKVGGTCLNRGCRPTKAMRASARVAHVARTAADHGVSTGEVVVDFAAVVARKDRLIDGWVESSTKSLEDTDGLSLVHGQARFTGSGDDGHVVAVGDRVLAAPRSSSTSAPGRRNRRFPASPTCRGSTTTASSTSTRCPSTS